MPAACSVMFRWQSCQSSSSTLLTSSMLSCVQCRFTLGFHRTNVKPLGVNTRPFMNDSGGRFALARSRLSSRHGAAPREMITAHRLRARRTDSILLAARCSLCARVVAHPSMSPGRPGRAGQFLAHGGGRHFRGRYLGRVGQHSEPKCPGVGQRRRGSARRPGPELVGVAYCPDVLYPVACDVEREHRHR